MQRDFMPAPMKIGDFIAADDTPEFAALFEKSRGDVEGRARAMRFNYLGASGMRADRHVVESESDQRLGVPHKSRRERQMPRDAMRRASCEPRH
jgi:hypothetical protein